MKKLLLGTLAIYLHLYAQQFDTAFNQPYPERMFQLDSLVRNVLKPKVEDSVFFLAQVKELRTKAEMKNDRKALFYADYLLFYYQMGASRMEEKELLQKFQQLYKQAQRLEMIQIQSNLYNDLGYYYYKRPNPNYILYFDNLNKGYELYKDLDIRQYPDKAYNLYSLALSYYQFGDYGDAIRFAHKVEPLPDGNNFTDLFTYNLLGMAYLKLNKFDSSRIYLEKTYQLANTFEKEKGLGWTGIALGNTGHTWYKEGKYEKAIPCYRQAIEICIQTQLWDNVSPFSSRLISSYTKLGQLDKARELIPLARRSTYLYNQVDGYFLFYSALADYYKAVKDGMPAIMYRDSAIFYNDSLQRTFDRNLKVQLQLSNYQEQAAAKDALYKSEKSRQLIIRNSIIVCVFLLLALAYIFYNRQQKLLRNKTVLLKEIHHRVKNNLQVISSILDIQQRTLNDEKLMQAFIDAKSRISSMALVHQNLYEKENVGATHTGEYFDQLFKIITASYAPKHIRITHAIHAEGKMNIDTLVPVALIFNELLTNTYKYAFTGRENGHIEFKLVQKNDGFHMSYRDNGKGFPEGFEWTKSRGLGSLMIRKFTQQLFGTYTVHSSAQGVEFIFIFKASKQN